MVMALALTYIHCHKKYSYARFSPFSNYFDFELFIFMHSMKNVCCIVAWADCCFWIRTADQNRKGPKLNGQNFNELLHILNLLSISTIVKMPKIGIHLEPFSPLILFLQTIDYANIILNLCFINASTTKQRTAVNRSQLIKGNAKLRKEKCCYKNGAFRRD